MNNDLKIIAISGKAQHGKDTFAEALKEELEERGYNVLLTHYADLLKYMCKNFFGWNGEKDEAGRHILQYVGTNVVRERYPDFWVNFIIDVLNLFPDEWDYILIPDTRFPNEIERLKESFDNVKLLKVIRPNFESTLTEEQKQHPSEIALDNYKEDITFYNEGTLNDIKEKIKLMEW